MRTGFLLLFLNVVSTLVAQDVTIPYEKFVLKNGLTVLVHEDHKAPIVAVNVWYHVGSKNEKAGKTGFAHLFEHLMFGGSENSKSLVINALEKVGATDLNGTTNNDRTNYFETVPVSALDYTLFIESDRMGHLLGTFDKKTLDLQRGVVQNEKRQGENQPYGVAYELITKASYPVGHPYSWTVIGSMEDLNAASLDDVKEWFHTYYGPSNAVLVLAGDIDAKSAKEKVEKYFGDIPPGPPVAHYQSWSAKMTGSHRQRVQDRVPQARLYKVWNIPGYGTPENDALDAVSDCLAQVKSSRLYKRLVYDDQIATSVQASVDPNEIGGQFTITVTARPGQDLAKIDAALNQELGRFMEFGPTQAELSRVKTQFAANFLRGLERVGGFGGKSDVLAQNAVYSGDPDHYKVSLRNHAAATPESIRLAAKQWLSDGDFSLEVLPFPPLTTVTGIDRSKMPQPGTPQEAKIPKLERTTLSNGLKVVLAERHDLPLLTFWMQLDAGYASDQTAVPGTARLTMSALQDGTKSRSALAISDEAGALGAQLSARAGLDSSVIRLSALKTNLGPSLDLFADVILNPSFPQSDFERAKKQQLAAIEQEQAEPFTMALRVLPGLMYGKEHAYSNPLTGSGTPESVAKIGREDLAKYHQTWFHPNGATLVVVGDTTLAAIKPRLERAFGAWKSAELPKKNIRNVALAKQPSVYLIDRPGSEQSVIMSGHVSPPRNNPREIATAVLNDNIGGTFSSRINMNLREDKHWSYGAFSTFLDAKGQSPFVLIAPVQTDKTKGSMAEINRDLRGLVSDKPVTEEELERARSNRILSMPGSKETIDAVGQSIQEITAYGFADDYFESYPGKLKTLRVADLNDAAKSVISPDGLIWVVVGDRSKIEKGIRELGLGDIHLLDATGKPLQ